LEPLNHVDLFGRSLIKYIEKMKKEYIENTLKAYQNNEKAAKYFEQHQKSLSWARLTMWLELRNVKKALSFFCNKDSITTILDIPCGTGVAGGVFSEGMHKVVAIDISEEMMYFAKESYNLKILDRFMQADITNIPLDDLYSQGAIVLGFMHRVPLEVKINSLNELSRVNKDFIVVSFTVDDIFQRMKRALFSVFKKKHASAPEPMKLSEIKNLINNHGFRVVRTNHVFPILSGEIMIWAKKER